MNKPELRPSSVLLTCAPHVPFLALQDRAVNAGFWKAYEARIAAFNAFDPELVIVFGHIPGRPGCRSHR